MAQEEIKYSLPSQVGGAQNGRQVDLIVTYDSTMRNMDGSYTVTSATGTYAIVNDSGAVTSVDTITGLVPAGTGGRGANDDELFLSSDPSTTPIVDYHGITYTISNPADSNITTSTDPQYGQVNFFDRNSNQSATSAPTDTPYYLEAGENHFEVTVTACFASGTMICTNEGNVSVENLMIGQFALTAFGVYRPIRWLGHRVMVCHSDPAATQPVRICAHAFGENRPARDLFVSPGHAICVDVLGEVLIPAGLLVNGSTIQSRSRLTRSPTGMSSSTATTSSSPRTCRPRAISTWVIAASSKKPTSSISPPVPTAFRHSVRTPTSADRSSTGVPFWMP